MKKTFKRVLSLFTAVAISASMVVLPVTTASAAGATALNDATEYVLDSSLETATWSVANGKITSKPTGQNVVFEMDMQKPVADSAESDGGTNMWATSNNFRMSADFSDGTSSYKLNYVDSGAIFLGFGTSNIGGRIAEVNFGNATTTSGWIKFRIEFDLPTQMMNIVVLNEDGTVHAESGFKQFSGGVDYGAIDWKKAYINELSLQATEYKDTSSWTFKNATLYSRDVNEIDVINDATEHVLDVKDEAQEYTLTNGAITSEPIGKHMVYEMDFIRPVRDTANAMWDGSPNYKIKTTISSNGRWRVTDQLIGMNHNNIVMGDDTYVSIKDATGTWLKLRIEFDVPNLKYKVEVYNEDGTLHSESTKQDIPSSSSNITDGLQDRFEVFQVYAPDHKEGSGLTFKNARLYYNDYILRAFAENGTVTSDGSAFLLEKVYDNTTKTLTFTADEGAELSKVLVNGSDVTSQLTDNSGTSATLTLNGFSEETTVDAVFAKSYTLTVPAPANGTVTVDGTAYTGGEEFEGETVALTLTPNKNYQLGSVKVGDTDVTSEVVDGVYNHTVTADATITVTFVQKPAHKDVVKNGTTYRTFNLALNGANSKAFMVDSLIDTETTWTDGSFLPDYQASNTLLTEKGLNNAMDSDGLIYDSEGVPFEFATGNDKNAFLFTAGHLTTTTIDMPNDRYSNLYMALDATYYPLSNTKVQINYTDGTSSAIKTLAANKVQLAEWTYGDFDAEEQSKYGAAVAAAEANTDVVSTISLIPAENSNAAATIVNNNDSDSDGKYEINNAKPHTAVVSVFGITPDAGKVVNSVTISWDRTDTHSTSLYALTAELAPDYTDVVKNGTTYRTFDLARYGANSKALMEYSNIGTGYIFSDGSKLPDYANANNILSESGLQALKASDADGLIYDRTGTPYFFATGNAKNAFMVGKHASVNLETATVDIPDGEYATIYVTLNQTYPLTSGDLIVTYSDGTTSRLGMTTLQLTDGGNTPTIKTYINGSLDETETATLTTAETAIKTATSAYSTIWLTPADSSAANAIIVNNNSSKVNAGTGHTALMPVYAIEPTAGKTVTSVSVTNTRTDHSISWFALTAEFAEGASLPEAKESHKLKLEAEVENGTVKVDGADLTTTGIDVEEGTEKTITLTPADGYELKSVTVNTVDQTSEVASGALTLTISADTTVAVEFEESARVTGGTVDKDTTENETDNNNETGTTQFITYETTSAERVTGKTMVFEMEMTKPVRDVGSAMWGGSPNYKIKAAFNNNSAWYVTDLVSFNHERLFLAGQTYNAENAFVLINDFDAEDYFTLRLEFDVPNKKYKMIVVAPNGTVTETAEVDLPAVQSGSLTDFSAAYIENVTVYGADVKLGSSVTFRNMDVYEKTYTLTATATGGTVKVGDEVITSISGILAGTKKELTFVADGTNTLESVKVDGVEKISDVQNNKLTITVNADTTVVVTFKTAQITGGTVDLDARENEEEANNETGTTQSITYITEAAQRLTGKYMVYEMKMQRPTKNTLGSVWGGSSSFRVQMKFSDGTNYKTADLVSINRDYMFPGVDYATTGCDYFGSYTASDEEYFTLRIEVSPQNRLYKIVILNPNGGEIHATKYFRFTDSSSVSANLGGSLADADFVNAYIESVTVYGSDVKPGSSLTFKDANVFEGELNLANTFTGNPVELDFPGEYVTYAPQDAYFTNNLIGKNQNIEVTVTRPADGKAEEFELWATLKGNKSLYDDGTFEVTGKGEAYEKQMKLLAIGDGKIIPYYGAGAGTALDISSVAVGAKLNIKLEFDFDYADDNAAGGYAITITGEAGNVVATAAKDAGVTPWDTEVENFYDYLGISSIKLQAIEALATGHTSTVSDMSIINPETGAEVLPMVITGTDSWSGDGDSYLGEWAYRIRHKSGAASGIDGTRPVVLEIPAGVYRMDKMFDMSSYAAVDGAKITFKAADDGEVIFKGSKLLDATKFTAVTDSAILDRIPESARGKVQVLDLGAQGITTDMIGEIPEDWRYFDDNIEKAAIYVNDVEQTNARWPNGENEYATFSSKSDTMTTGGKDSNGNYYGTGTSTLTITNSDQSRAAKWATAPEARLIGFLSTDYSYDRVKITEINGTTITFDNENPNGATNVTEGTSDSKRYAVYNLLEELDVPGEYYIDSANCLLYYYPTKPFGEDDTLEISVQDDLIKLSNTANWNFDGITFAQARGSAFYMSGTGATNVTIQNCTFENLSRFGLCQHEMYSYSKVGAGTEQSAEFLEGGNENFHLLNNKFLNIGYEAFFLVFGSRDANEHSNSSIKNNYIYNMGRNNKKSVAMNVLGVGVDIGKNTIHRTGYGINFNGDHMDINQNEVYNVMNHLNDGAAIYTGRDFVNRNNIIQKNYIHDVNGITTTNSANGTQDWQWGIYLDDKTWGVKIDRNIIADAAEGVALNGGSKNTVTNNTIVNTDGNYIISFGISSWGDTSNVAYKDIQTFVNNINNNSLTAYSGNAALSADMNDSGNWVYSKGNTFQNNVAYGSKIDNTTSGANGFLGSSGTGNQYISGYDSHRGDANNSNNFGGDQLLEAGAFVNAAGGDFRLNSAASGSDALTAADINLTDFGSAFIGDKKLTGDDFNLNYAMVDGSKTVFNWNTPVGADDFGLSVTKNTLNSSDKSQVTKTGAASATTTAGETTYEHGSALAEGLYEWTGTAVNQSVNNGERWNSSATKFRIGDVTATLTTQATEGGNVTFTVDLYEYIDADTIVYVAVYDANDKMLDIQRTDDTGKAVMAASAIEGAAKVKVMTWKNFVPLWAAEARTF